MQGRSNWKDAKGKLIAGPFHVCARAHDELAQANGNRRIASRSCAFGDMPLGEYQITQVIPSGPGTPYAADEFGSSGIVFLQPKHGEAVLADANGRFIFYSRRLARPKRCRCGPTEDGSLRLSNRHQRKLIGVLRRHRRECMPLHRDQQRERKTPGRRGPSCAFHPCSNLE